MKKLFICFLIFVLFISCEPEDNSVSLEITWDNSGGLWYQIDRKVYSPNGTLIESQSEYFDGVDLDNEEVNAKNYRTGEYTWTWKDCPYDYVVVELDMNAYVQHSITNDERLEMYDEELEHTINKGYTWSTNTY